MTCTRPLIVLFVGCVVASAAASECKDGFVYLEGGCYLAECPELTWDRANAFCADSGASLVVINSKVEGEALNIWLKGKGLLARKDTLEAFTKSLHNHSEIHSPFWTGLIDLDDYVAAVAAGQATRRRRRDAADGGALPYQCVLDRDEGFRCFAAGKAVTVCEAKPLAAQGGGSRTH